MTSPKRHETWRRPWRRTVPGTLVLFFLFFSLFSFVSAQDCSATRPCATGCCSKFGYCGTGPDFCSPENCVGTCDYKLGCDASNPCKSGCCNKFGFCGLGPDYCAKDVCVAGCESKAYCDPGFGPEWAEVAHCPLNVCCSKYGFCGLTEEFCGETKVKRPSCDVQSARMNYVVGYYEGWSRGRPCNKFYPEQIPLGVYTHLNFAFATIDPQTFEVRPASKEDINLYRRLTYLKQFDPDLKVYIAIGGWTFNDPGPTATTFSDIARSEVNQKKFIRSLISFMSTYDFDGVDLDWEYPVADDRSGRPEDFENFPRFIRNLKAALKKTPGRSGLTITLPASYWYLQHFDLKKLEKHVDFFNIMSYDLHGIWDKGNKWLGEYLNAHTNLTEITDAMDLMWRNDIPPTKVVLGMAFYARAFTAVDCTEPGCLFSSAAAAGPCSNEVGILLNSEIDEIVASNDLTPKLYEDAAVKVAVWDSNQWVAYDDAETFKLKADFALGQCLGGIMVWAVSHDTRDAKYSKALAEVTKRRDTSLVTKPGEFYQTEVAYQIDQCMWTNCEDNCPNGMVRMLREDGFEKGTHFITDETGCPEGMQHQFCCPPKRKPKCGWWTHNNGNCDAACPKGMLEIGSLAMYCHSGNQLMCCETGSESLALYENGDWNTKTPDCDDYPCPAGRPELTRSSTGSGGAVCRLRDTTEDFWDPSTWDPQERLYCVDNNQEDKNWKNCVKGVTGLFSPILSIIMPDVCVSSCLAGKIRIAMDAHGDCYFGGGAISTCCDNNYVQRQSIVDPELELEGELVTDFLRNPTCPSSMVQKRGETNRTSNEPAIFAETAKEDYILVAAVLARLLFGPSDEQYEIDLTAWTDGIRGLYSHLNPYQIKEWLPSSGYYAEYGLKKTTEVIVCNLDKFNERIKTFLNPPSSPALCACVLPSDLDPNPAGVPPPYRTILTASKRALEGVNFNHSRAEIAKRRITWSWSDVEMGDGMLGVEPSTGYMLRAILGNELEYMYTRLIRYGEVEGIIEVAWRIPSDILTGNSYRSTPSDEFYVMHFHVTHVYVAPDGQRYPGVYGINHFHGQEFNYRENRVNGRDNHGDNLRTHVVECDRGDLFIYPGHPNDPCREEEDEGLVRDTLLALRRNGIIDGSTLNLVGGQGTPLDGFVDLDWYVFRRESHSFVREDGFVYRPPDDMPRVPGT